MIDNVKWTNALINNFDVINLIIDTLFLYYDNNDFIEQYILPNKNYLNFLVDVAGIIDT
jgi:hypothetical protein